MPLQEKDKLDILQRMGLNPAEYDVVDASQDEAAPPATSIPTALQAATSGFKRSVIPAAGGLGAAALAMAPFTEGTSLLLPLAVGLGSAALGSWGTSKLQEKALQKIEGPEKYAKDLEFQQQAQTAHPYAYQGGALAGQLPTMGLNLNAAKGVSSLLLGQKLARSAQQGLMTAGVGAGMQGGIDVAEQMVGDRAYDPAQTGLQMLGGAAISEPRFGMMKPRALPEPPITPEVVKSLPEAPTQATKPTQDVERVKQQLIELDKPEDLAKLTGEVKPSYATDATSEVKSGIPTKVPEELNPYLDPQDEGYNADPTQRFYQNKTTGQGLTPEQLAQAQDYAKLRGVSLKEEPKIVDPKTGEEKAGYSLPKERVAVASSTAATSDTPYHEIGGHQVPEDYLASANLRDRATAERVIAAANGKEPLAEYIGNRILEIKSAPLKTYLQDVWANAKRLAGSEDPKALMRNMARRAEGDRPYSESPEYWKPKMGADPEPSIRYQGKGLVPEQPAAEKSLYPDALTPVIQQLKNLNQPSATKAAEAGEAFRRFQREYLGKFQNKGLDIMQGFKEPEKVMQWLHENRFTEGKSKIILQPEDIRKLQSYRDLMVAVHEEQRGIGRNVGPEQRQAEDNPHYSPTMISEEVLKVLGDGKDAAKIKGLKEDFINHEIKYSPIISKLAKDKQVAAATEILNSRLRELNSSHGQGSPEFGAVTTAEGHGLPYSWTEKDPQQMIRRYTDRIARDFAFHKAVLQSPELRQIFNFKDKYGKTVEPDPNVAPVSHPALGILFRQMTHAIPTKSAPYSALESTVRAGLLGPSTGIINHVSGYPIMASYIPTQDLPKMVTSWKNFSKGMADSFEQGVNRKTTLDLEVKDPASGYWPDKIRTLANTLRKLQGANAIEQGTRGLHMAIGEAVAESTWGRIKAGSRSVEDISFLRHFGDKNLDYRTEAINDAELQRIAANFVERVQGTYDERGLPPMLVEPTSPAYWFLSLNKWNVERAHIVKKDIFEPALKGDFLPLIKYTLATTLTGAAIVQLKELMNNKRDAQPNFSELVEAGKASDWLLKFVQLNKLASFGGIIGDAIYLVGANLKGYRTNPIGSVPALDTSVQQLTNMKHLGEAISQGADLLNTFYQFAVDSVVNNIQAARLANNFTPQKSQDIGDQDKRKDLEIYKKLTDLPLPPEEGPIDTNPYFKVDEKRFKHAKTFEEARRIMDTEIKPRLGKLNPEEAKADIKGLERNSYQTIPEDRRQATKYLDYLSRVKSPEEATALQQDKRAQDILNRRKSRLIPRAPR